MHVTMTQLTRTDCTRDNRAVVCPHASLLGFGTRTAKRGMWIRFDNHGQEMVGRVIGRVVCESQVYVEVAAAMCALSSVAIRWAAPKEVQEIRPAPPAAVFAFLAGDWSTPAVFAALEHGVSDLQDQLNASAADSVRSRRPQR